MLRLTWNAAVSRGALLALLLLLGAPAPGWAQAYVMEVATVVPEGSAWVEQLEAFKEYVEQQTEGRVKVTLRLSRMNERSSARQLGRPRAHRARGPVSIRVL